MFIDLAQLNGMQKQAWLQHAVAPRPICFASTIDKAGNVNLSPFSFFNLFSSHPPIIIFSPARRGRDNTTKHTLQNVLEHAELVVNICDYDMVQQLSLASCEFAKGVNEFDKAGFTMEASTMVKPPRVKESKVQMECKVIEVKSLGEEGGAGQLVIAEVLCMHVAESILNAEGSMIDQTKLEHVARCGGDWYVHVTKENLFQVPKPNTQLGIGVDALPSNIRNSKILTGNHLGMLANVHAMPDIDPAFADDHVKQIVQYYSINPDEMESEMHKHASKLLNAGEVQHAWQVLLAVGN
jgi:flavin reductase (DIM6/NTAB) family NADH-FMN oxidoreductase RutF